MTKAIPLLVVVALLQYSSGQGFGVITQTIPESGSIIAGFVGEDITAFCEVEATQGNQQITLWHRQKEDDPGNLLSINADDTRFVTTGEPVPAAGNLTFRTNLTIISLTLDLDANIVFCGTAGSLMAANFIIRVYVATVGTDQPSYTVNEFEDLWFSVSIIDGQTVPGQQCEIQLGEMDHTATGGEDYVRFLKNVTLTDTVTSEQCHINLIDDLLCEPDETLYISLLSLNDNCVVNSSFISVTILDDDVAEVSIDQSSFTVWEHNESVLFDVSITGEVRKAPGQECEIRVYTEFVTATEGEDYVPIMKTVILDDSVTSEPCHIDILDDLDCESVEQFYIRLESLNPNCNVNNTPIPVNILDDEDCCARNPNRSPCHPSAICKEEIGPDNFTCFCQPGLWGDGIIMCFIDLLDIPTPPGPMMGDDPHFSIALPGGKLLCYTVQGEHGFTFNLISNEKVFMNALFVPDSRRDEVTWLGSMGIIATNRYRKSNSTALRFEALEKKIYINDKVVLQPRNVEMLTFSNGKLTISEATPVEGFKYPKVYVNLRDVGLSFSIQFLAEHLDLFWHSTGQQTENSHGIIGQFFRKGVEIDEVRKILIIPNKEPVPVMRRPVWSFMEREKVTSDDELCWMAMNPGYQGEGLIDGTYFDYLVNDVLSTDFNFKKQ